MGAATFDTYAEGTDIAAAFAVAVGQARYDYGNRGYTGTIAEKDDYVVVEPTPLIPEAAAALAVQLMDADDDRISNKWGPAGAIAVKSGVRTRERLPIPARDGGYPDLRAAAEAAAVDLAEGEVIDDVPSAQYAMRADGGIGGGGGDVVTITTTGYPDQTGWLFFGWASC